MWQPIDTVPHDMVVDLWTPGHCDPSLGSRHHNYLWDADCLGFVPVQHGVCVIRDATHWSPRVTPDGTQMSPMQVWSHSTLTGKLV